MATNVELRKSNGSNFNEVIHIKTNYKLVEGLLDDDGKKLHPSLIPTSVMGAMRYVDTLGASTTLADLYSRIGTWLVDNDQPTDVLNYVGKYFVVGSAKITVTQVDPYVYRTTDAGASDYILEPRDWVIFSGINAAGKYTFSVINNTYDDATTTVKGIVELATSTEALTGTDGDRAVTPAALKYTIDNAKLNASNLDTGIVPNARLDSNIVFKNVANIFNLKQTMPSIELMDTEGSGHRATLAPNNLGDSVITFPTGEGVLAFRSEIDGLEENVPQVPFTVFAGPSIGDPEDPINNALPTFRNLVSGDIPSLPASKITTGTFDEDRIPDIGIGKLKSGTVVGQILTTSEAGGIIASSPNAVKSLIGLGNVVNLGLASAVQAKAGEVDTAYMTPLRTKEAIYSLSNIEIVSEANIPTTFGDYPDGRFLMVEIPAEA